MKILAALLLSVALILPTAAFTSVPHGAGQGTMLVKHKGKHKHKGGKKANKAGKHAGKHKGGKKHHKKG